MSQNQKTLSEYKNANTSTTTIAIRKDQREKLEELKIVLRAKTYVEVLDHLLSLYEEKKNEEKKNEERRNENEEKREEIGGPRDMPEELKIVIQQTCRKNPELRAYLMFFVKKYSLPEKVRRWVEQWNHEINCRDYA